MRSWPEVKNDEGSGENVDSSGIERLAQKYQLDEIEVMDIIAEGFTLDEAEEIIREAEM